MKRRRGINGAKYERGRERIISEERIMNSKMREASDTGTFGHNNGAEKSY